MSISPSRRFLLVLGIVATSAAGVGAAWSQARPEDASLASVTAELRQLRLTLDESMRGQAQTQALAVLLATQQSRIVQLNSRLDAVRAELGPAADKARKAAEMVAMAQAQLARTQDLTQRAGIESTVRYEKAEADKAAAVELQIRNRESAIMADLAAEEARWADFVGRLEQLIKR